MAATHYNDGMGTSVASPVPVALPYADLPARWGVTVERSPAGVRVTVPPVRWNQLGRGWYVGIGVLVAVIVWIGVASLAAGEIAAFWGNAAIYGMALTCVVLVAVERLRRRIAFEVTADRFGFVFSNVRRAFRAASWPRDKVADVRLNPQNGKLLIRVTGIDLVELYLGPNRQVNTFVAETLAGALHETFATAAGDDPASQSPAGPPSIGGPAGPARWLLLGAGAALLLLGLAILVYPWPYRPLAFYAMVAAGVPFGIVYGTQDKDYYFF